MGVTTEPRISDHALWRELAAGKSAGQIAAQVGVSRQAIAKRAHRLQASAGGAAGVAGAFAAINSPEPAGPDADAPGCNRGQLCPPARNLPAVLAAELDQLRAVQAGVNRILAAVQAEADLRAEVDLDGPAGPDDAAYQACRAVVVRAHAAATELAQLAVFPALEAVRTAAGKQVELLRIRAALETRDAQAPARAAAAEAARQARLRARERSGAGWLPPKDDPHQVADVAQLSPAQQAEALVHRGGREPQPGPLAMAAGRSHAG